MEEIPFVPGEPYNNLLCTLDGVQYQIKTHWNELEGAHYMDLYEGDGDPILKNIKVVLGILLGQGCSHPFFDQRALFAIDSSAAGEEAGVDDLGARINVVYLTETDVFIATSPPTILPSK